jgi:DNA-binding NarL/FixJ family response regulator
LHSHELQCNEARDAIRVGIVSEVRLYREGLAATLAARANLSVVGTAANRAEALDLIAREHPDVMVLDMAMAGALDLARAMGREAPSVKTVAFAIAELDRDVLVCAQAGVAGYVPCEASTDDLAAVIESVTRDELLCSPRIAAALFRRVAALSGADEPAAGASLTRRERQIARLIENGLSNKEIASHLVIEVATVKNHVHNILDKFGLTTRGEIAARLRDGRVGGPSRPPHSSLP